MTYNVFGVMLIVGLSIYSFHPHFLSCCSTTAQQCFVVINNIKYLMLPQFSHIGPHFDASLPFSVLRFPDQITFLQILTYGVVTPTLSQSSISCDLVMRFRQWTSSAPPTLNMTREI